MSVNLRGETKHRPRLGILISGRGSNMVALLDAIDDGRVAADAAIVISNRPEAGGLAVAAARGVTTRALDHRAFPDRPAFEAALDGALRAAGVEIVVCAGFMRVLTDRFVAGWADLILNIHPSLLPAFPGLDTHGRALAARVAVHGCTVHVVTAGVDEGPILGQAVLRVRPDDTPDSLAARLLPLEHRLYPEVLARYLRDGPGMDRVCLSAL